MFPGAATFPALLQALRHHEKEKAEAQQASLQLIRLVGSKASSTEVRTAYKRLKIEFDPSCAMTPRLKQVMPLSIKAAGREIMGTADLQALVYAVLKGVLQQGTGF